ncbi:MAG: hypothetical protein K0R63_1723 [Rickettsiales bacterium]|nr:hypothetical protein [Rickettsiales bacterium]
MTKVFIYGMLVMAAIAVGCAAPAYAHHTPDHKELSDTDKQGKVPSIEGADHTVTVDVNGLVCDFCARSLEKLFMQREEVSGIDVNLTTKKVSVGLKKGMDIDDATLTGLITDAGYNVVSITR